ncbi:MAG: hypothetical protein ACKOTE_18680, partial [Opitutaceae bacterium]
MRDHRGARPGDVAAPDEGLGAVEQRGGLLGPEVARDLRAEKASALLDRAQALVRGGDIAGARAAMIAHDQLASP